jgi:hypothetical protein
MKCGVEWIQLEIRSSQSGVAEDTSVLGCDAMLLDKWFRRFEGSCCLHVQGQLVHNDASSPCHDAESLRHTFTIYVGRDSSVGIATCYGLDGPGIESRWGRDFSHPSRPAHPPSSSARVKERVQLYLYSPSGPAIGWPLPLRFIFWLWACTFIWTCVLIQATRWTRGRCCRGEL